MIPILFFGEATAFNTNGIGRLAECISCTVTEERNGIYECEFSYPITGRRYDDIKEGRLIVCTHDDKQDLQPFRIYRRSAPINGIVTFNARHISYDLSSVILKPFEAATIAAAFNGLRTNSMNENKFTFWTDKATTADFKVAVPVSIKEILGGVEGSILDVFGGGEYEWDKFTVKLYQTRGTDSGVTIRYGKNLMDITHEIDVGDLYTAVVPYWQDSTTGEVVYGDIVYGPAATSDSQRWNEENNVVMTDENGNLFDFTYSRPVVVPMDLTQEFGMDVVPTLAQLKAKALTKLRNGQAYIPKENIKVDFVQLWQTDEYADVAVLQRVGLCDTVSVYYPALGVKAEKQKVIKVVYNVLLDRYDSMEIGVAQTSFAQVVTGQVNEALSHAVTIDVMSAAIESATDLITGGRGGHVVFQMDADGKPQEIYIMDTEDVNTAVHVLRMNVNGIGFSSNGINGPYASAWTLDGRFVADFITTGNLNASLITTGAMSADFIQGGTLSLGQLNNRGGILEIRDGNGNVIGRWTNEGISVSKGVISGPSIALGGNNNESGLMQIYNASGQLIGFWDNTGIHISSGSITGSTIRSDHTTYSDSYLQLKNCMLDAYYQGTRIYTLELDGGRIFERIRTGGKTFYLYGSDASDYILFSGATNDYDRFRFNNGLRISGGGSVSIYENPTSSSPTSRDRTASILAINRQAGGSQFLNMVMLGSAQLYQRVGYSEIVLAPGGTSSGTIYVYGGLVCSGTKNRVVKTDNYDERLLYAYETPSPMFGDVGSGETDDEGLCVISIDDTFAETIFSKSYHVFLQKEGRGDLWVKEKANGFFVVEGTPNLKFSWEIKARQKGYECERLERLPSDDDYLGAYSTLEEEMLENDVISYLDEQEELLYETA